MATGDSLLDARAARLALTYTDPLNPRLREELASRGPVELAAILLGGDRVPDHLRSDSDFMGWVQRLRTLDPWSELSRLAAVGIRFITPGEAEWPAQLDDLDFPPFGLYVFGSRPIPAHEKMVALVGSRDATAYGLSVTGDMAAGLVGRGYSIVSGGAYGIDAQAHRVALVGENRADVVPPTIAVLANGLDRLYPAGNNDLLRAVGERGLLISEVPLGSSPTRKAFLNRNRIIAALSESTVVVEARYRSGAMSTAHHAQKLGRLLGAVPGSVYSANSVGTHRLVREFEAQLVTSADDIAELEYFRTER